MVYTETKKQNQQYHFWLLMMQNFVEDVCHDFIQGMTLRTKTLFFQEAISMKKNVVRSISKKCYIMSEARQRHNTHQKETILQNLSSQM